MCGLNSTCKEPRIETKFVFNKCKLLPSFDVIMVMLLTFCNNGYVENTHFQEI